MKAGQESGSTTRKRLLRAAGEVFSQYGFRASTVREISRRAGANVAAVNYYFGNKRGLYSAVLKYTLNSALQKYPPEFGLDSGATAEERLHAFIRSFLFRVLDEGRPAWYGKLMAREISEPTAALDELVEQSIRPLHERLIGIVRELIGKDAGDGPARLCALSIIGQCLFYHHGRTVIARIYPQEFSAGQIERLADHVTQFSVGAIRTFAKTNGQG
jgi:AcrR family transcriptional regulator